MTQFDISAFALTHARGGYRFTLTPKSALAGNMDIRWVIVPKGDSPAGDYFSDLTGTLSFAFGSTAAQTITIAPPYDNFEIQIYQIVSDGDDILIGSHDVTHEDESARKASASTLRYTTTTKLADDNDLDLSSETTAQKVVTGDGHDAIIDGQGDDYIETGRGDDTIALSTGGDDTVAYNFESESDTVMAVDGNNRVTGFTRGADIILFKADAKESAITSLNAFLKDGQGTPDDNFADDKFIVTIDYEIVAGPEGGAAYVVVFTGITFHFRESAVYGGNKLSMPLFNIKFDASMTTAELFAVSGGRENLDGGRGVALKKLVELDDDGEVTTNYIANILGADSIDFEVESLTLTGDSDSDVLTGGAGDDTLYGLAGNDILNGLVGDDTLYGGDNDDYLAGGAGDDTLYGGDGWDDLYGGDGDDTLYGGDGDDTLFGGSGNDTLYGGAGDDVLVSGDGNDILDGGAGDDYLWGDDDDDTLDGGDGDDTLDGGDGTDTAVFDYGSATSNLTLDTTAATRWKQNADGTWASGTGAEYEYQRFVADGETDYFINIENFEITAGASDDTLTGGAGNDSLTGGGGDDVLDGGDGDDTAVFDYSSATANLTLDVRNTSYTTYWKQNSNGTWSSGTGAGYDYQRFQIDISAAGDGTDIETNYYKNIENFKITGGAGDDEIIGGDGLDYLDGGDGDDTLLGGGGNDILGGGNGTDTAVFGYNSATAALTLDVTDATRWKQNADGTWSSGTGAGYDYQRFQVDISATGDGSDIETDYFKNIEEFSLGGGSGNDVLTGGAGDDSFGGGAGDDRLDGGSGDDTIYGGADNDKLYGGDGDDQLYGGFGNDTLDGGAGDDILDGGADDDTAVFDYSSAVADLTLNAKGTQRYKQNADGTWAYDWAADYQRLRADISVLGDGTDIETDYFKNIERLIITSGSGNDYISGNRGNDELYGGAGNDILTGHTGNDRLNGGDGDDGLFGNGGNDYLYGEAGNDTLFDDAGDDTLLGGAGNDTLYGGADNDILDGGADTDTAVFDYYSFRYAIADLTLDVTDTTRWKLDGTSAEDTAADYADYEYQRFYADLNNDGQENDGDEFDYFKNIENFYIIGDSGNDVLTGGSGTNILDGGDGDDTAVFDYSSATANLTLNIADISNDTTRWKLDDNGDWTQTGATSADYRRLQVDISAAGDGTDIETDYFKNIERFSITAGSGNDVLTGGAGDDTLTGGDGNDTLTGDAGDDTLYGEAGDDTLYGGADNDKLYGGAGNDILDGGLGRDTAYFDYRAATANLTLDVRNNAYTTYWQQDRNGDWTQAGATAANYWRLQADVSAAGDGTDIETDYFRNIYSFQIYAGSGNDVLAGGVRNDWLYGNGGNDILDGGAGDDILDGGDGDDTAVFDYSSATADLRLNLSDARLWKQNSNGTWSSGTGAGYDYQSFQLDRGRNWTIDETDYYKNIENFYIIASYGDDYLEGGGGNDKLDGGAGNDILDGGAGDDILDGGAGGSDWAVFRYSFATADLTLDATVAAYWKQDSNGDWTQTGATSADYRRFQVDLDGDGTIDETDYYKNIKIFSIFAGDGNDVLTGGAGNDQLSGRKGNDKLYGGAGNDDIGGNDGDDTLYGGDGRDNLYGDDGRDTLYGEADNDTLYGGDGYDELYGGTGTDYLYGGDGRDNLYGDAGNDILNGDAGDDNLDGGSGNDTLLGGSDRDTLYGRHGNDWLYGDTGNDILDGGAGNDRLDGAAGYDRGVFDYNATVRLSLGVSTNTTYWKQDGNGNWTQTGATSADYRRFQVDLDGDGTIDETDYFRNIENFEIHGGSINDSIGGGDGHDYLHGKGGNDRLYGGAGEDELWGEEDNDYLYGEEDNDRLYGGSGNDRLDGGDGYDTLRGGDGDDKLYGDTLGKIGGQANDYLYGDAGDDYLSGDRGDDELDGGAGNDRLDGFFGNDIFVLNLDGTSNDLDTVLDFNRWSGYNDKIQVNTDRDSVTSLATLKAAANIYWTNNSNFSSNFATDNPATNDTIIYSTNGTADTSDDFALMVLEDYTTELTFTDFDII